MKDICLAWLINRVCKKDKVVVVETGLLLYIGFIKGSKNGGKLLLVGHDDEASSVMRLANLKIMLESPLNYHYNPNAAFCNGPLIKASSFGQKDQDHGQGQKVN